VRFLAKIQRVYKAHEKNARVETGHRQGQCLHHSQVRLSQLERIHFTGVGHVQQHVHGAFHTARNINRSRVDQGVLPAAREVSFQRHVVVDAGVLQRLRTKVEAVAQHLYAAPGLGLCHFAGRLFHAVVERAAEVVEIGRLRVGRQELADSARPVVGLFELDLGDDVRLVHDAAAVHANRRPIAGVEVQ